MNYLCCFVLFVLFLVLFLSLSPTVCPQLTHNHQGEEADHNSGDDDYGGVGNDDDNDGGGTGGVKGQEGEEGGEGGGEGGGGGGGSRAGASSQPQQQAQGKRSSLAGGKKGRRKPAGGARHKVVGGGDGSCGAAAGENEKNKRAPTLLEIAEATAASANATLAASQRPPGWHVGTSMSGDPFFVAPDAELQVTALAHLQWRLRRLLQVLKYSVSLSFPPPCLTVRRL